MMPFIIAFVVFVLVMALVVWLARRNDSGTAGAPSDSSFVTTTSALTGSSDYSSSSHLTSVDCSSSHSADSGSCGH